MYRYRIVLNFFILRKRKDSSKPQRRLLCAFYQSVISRFEINLIIIKCLEGIQIIYRGHHLSLRCIFTLIQTAVQIQTHDTQTLSETST